MSFHSFLNDLLEVRQGSERVGRILMIGTDLFQCGKRDVWTSSSGTRLTWSHRMVCSPPRFRTTARELQRAHLRVPALQTPPKFHEKTPRERKKERKWRRERENKREILGSPPSGPHPAGPHTAGPHSSRPPTPERRNAGMCLIQAPSAFDGPFRSQRNRHKSFNATPQCHVSIEIHLHHRPATGRILIDVPPKRPINSNSAPVPSRVCVPRFRVLGPPARLALKSLFVTDNPLSLAGSRAGHDPSFPQPTSTITLAATSSITLTSCPQLIPHLTRIQLMHLCSRPSSRACTQSL